MLRLVLMFIIVMAVLYIVMLIPKRQAAKYYRTILAYYKEAGWTEYELDMLEMELDKMYECAKKLLFVTVSGNKQVEKQSITMIQLLSERYMACLRGEHNKEYVSYESVFEPMLFHDTNQRVRVTYGEKLYWERYYSNEKHLQKG